jgi:cation diffusion facilitator CzcD-associated flavoprotein CzcO
MILKGARMQLPGGYPVDAHFKPSYEPWDQRLCIVPDGDLFKAIGAGRASIVTDRIERFTERGIRLESGGELPADIVVAATGLKLLACGGIALEVDGRRIETGKTYSYKGVMLSRVPNLAVCLGYTNSSWTLRADLSSMYLCRLLRYMDRHGYVQATPRHDDPGADAAPILDLKSGYIQRSLELLPKQGAKAPWKVAQNYVVDLARLKFGALDDGALEFLRAARS